MTDQPETQLERMARAIDPEAFAEDTEYILDHRPAAFKTARAVAEAPLTDAVIEVMARAIKVEIGDQWAAQPLTVGMQNKTGDWTATGGVLDLTLVGRAAAEAQRAAILAGK